MSLTLTPAELLDLTGRHTRPSQARALRRMGIPYRDRGDRIVVLRSDLEGRRPEPEPQGPDWNGLAAVG